MPAGFARRTVESGRRLEPLDECLQALRIRVPPFGGKIIRGRSRGEQPAQNRVQLVKKALNLRRRRRRSGPDHEESRLEILLFGGQRRHRRLLVLIQIWKRRIHGDTMTGDWTVKLALLGRFGALATGHLRS